MIKALTFDVIGTVVDWRGSLTRAFEQVNFKGGISRAVNDWVSYYVEGEIKTKEDLRQYGIDILLEHESWSHLTGMEMKRLGDAWLYLEPWPDAVCGLRKLRHLGFSVSTLTNCTYEVMNELSWNAGLYWTYIFSAKSVGVKKPDRQVYEYALERLNIPAEEVCMVAAHKYDLLAAQKVGFKTAFVDRGDDSLPAADEKFDYVVKDFFELAEQLS